jgi:hypothetical protein
MAREKLMMRVYPCAVTWYPVGAETTPEVCTMKPEHLPFQAAPFSGHASVIGLSNLHPATRKGAS